jgi:hypothetical protein
MGLFDRARRSGPIRRTGPDRFAVDLDPQVRELLGSFVDQLRQLLGTDSELLVRLFPPAYGEGDDADERNAGYAILAGTELRELRLAQLDEVAEHLDATELDEAQLLAWMRSVNDIRLVMGTMLGLSEDGVEPRLEGEDLAAYQVYEFFGALLDAIVAALAS